MYSIFHERTVPNIEHIILRDRVQRVVRNIKTRTLLIPDLLFERVEKYVFSIDPSLHHEYYIEENDCMVRMDKWVNERILAGTVNVN